MNNLDMPLRVRPDFPPVDWPFMVPVFSDLVPKSFTSLALQLMQQRAELTLLPEVWVTGLNLCTKCDLGNLRYGVSTERMYSVSCELIVAELTTIPFLMSSLNQLY